jgi:hypothetical protein
MSVSVKVDPFYALHDCRLAICPGPNKHPVHSGYVDDETRAADIQPLLDAGEQRYCWLLDYNVIIVDVDLHHPDQNGLISLANLSRDIGIDLRARCRAVVQTPTGGLHLIWRKPAEMQIMSIDRSTYPALDTLSKSIRRNALVIAVGSTHPTAAGLYQWVTEPPVLEMAPPELLSVVERKQPIHVPPTPEAAGVRVRGGGVTPVSDFLSRWEGVELLAEMLSELGYGFALTAEEFEGREQPFYEYQRAGKTTGSRISGYLGKRSREGNFLLTNFSHSDPYFEPGATVTIAEAMCRLLNAGKGFDGDGREERVRGLMGFLASRGFGLLSDQDMFGQVVSQVEAAEAGVELLPVEGEFWNYENVERGKDTVRVGKTMPELLQPFLLEGWPRACNGTLFVPRPDGSGIRLLPRTGSLMAWIQEHKKVYWAEKGDKVTKSEFFEGLLNRVPAYSSVSLVPHYPKQEGVFYVDDVEAGRVEDLYEFVDHFAPESEIDRQLMIAAIATVFWGGAGGSRPLFLLTSVDGQGAGKSTFVQSIARLVGLGEVLSHQIRTDRDFHDLPRAIGSAAPASPLSARMITVDNYQGAMLGGAAIESIITEPMLAVWKLYEGEVRIPNLYTWFVTGNFVDMSEDLAQRMVEIRIVKRPYSDAWSRKLAGWDLRKVVAGVRPKS